MRFSPKGKRERRLVVELTSMVDIVFLLIIFFMVTSDFARDARAEVDLPLLQGERAEQSEEAGLFINIDAEGNIILSTSESPVTVEQLADRLRKLVIQETTPKVTVRADRNASIIRFNEVIRALNESGVSSARIATEVPR
ncbi:MAG: biopolymer transporter ExbD [Phycisphaerales bacterium]|nr:biopolymer transporter ExbD [Phycisphaerales bacterium]